MKPFHCLLAILCTACLCEARPVRAWTYQELVKESDLIVIATPINSQDLKDRVEVPNLSTVDNAGNRKPLMAIGVETRFQVQAVLKPQANDEAAAKKEFKEFVVFHMRQPDNEPAAPNGPMFASFNLKQPTRYLLFLKREADGRYVSVTGQADTLMGVKELRGYP